MLVLWYFNILSRIKHVEVRAQCYFTACPRQIDLMGLNTSHTPVYTFAFSGGTIDLRVWQEGSSGQECHIGSGLELDFLFVPLLLWVSALLGVMELKVMTTPRRGEHFILLSGHIQLCWTDITGCIRLLITLGCGQYSEFLHLWEILGSNLSSVYKVNVKHIFPNWCTDLLT